MASFHNHIARRDPISLDSIQRSRPTTQDASSIQHYLAILDDYQDIATPIFSSLHQELSMTVFRDTISPSTSSGLERLATRLQPFTIISTMRERTAFPASLVSRLPNLKLLLTTGPKNAAIDLQACRDHNVIVSATGMPKPSESPKPALPDATTTHTWALILALSRHLARDHDNVRRGGWQGSTLATPISGRTLGLVGLGRLGTAVGRIAVQSWGMNVIAWSPNLTKGRADSQAKAAGLEPGEFKCVSKERCFADADVVSLHMVLSDATRRMITGDELAQMKRSALFINTSRGPLVDEESLLKACREGRLGGVALDVFDTEPLPTDSTWRTEEWGKDGRTEVLLSPHMGYGQDDTIRGWYQQNAANLKSWLEGGEVGARL